jgi:3-oxoacyl-[acyl-carrier protein] reductase
VCPGNGRFTRYRFSEQPRTSVRTAGSLPFGSIFADHVPRPGSAIYAMTKGAVAGFTRGLARELGPRGITVDVAQPGPTSTDANPDSGEFADAMRERTAVGHCGRPDDIAR